MDRRRAVAALLALAACSAAAPTATNQTALELSDGPMEGCYYNFQHYGEGDRIMTNEPCLNCTCHNRMLMCYLRVCPFTKPIGQDCTVEKRADQCCPIVTCPDVPVDLLTSTSTSSPAEYGTTGVGKHDRYGCSIDGKYFSEGSKVPPTPNKPCEHCYCIRNMTTCVMQECTLHVDGCTPIYHKDVCCPVRYSCDHTEDEIPLLDDMTTTVRPTPGFLLTTTTVSPVTQLTQDCVHDEEIFPDGAHIKTDKACEHCYCMKGDIVCVVQGCGTPMENEGKNCTALPLRPGQCCPDTYICEGDEQAGDLTTEIILQTTIPPRRVAVEGSGYRNEPGEPFTEMSPFDIDEEGSGDEYATTISIDTVEDVAPEKEGYETDDEILKLTTEKGMHIGLTESDKELSTIPDIILNKESSTLPVEDIVSQTTEHNQELIATTAEFINKIPDKHETIEDDVHKKDELITTESVFRKEDNDIISDEVLLHKEHDDITTTFIDLIDATPNKEENEVDVNKGTDLLSEHDNKATTESVKYTSGYLNTVSQKETTTEKQSESTDTEINKLNGEYPSETASETNIYGTSTKAVTENMDLLDTTPINININEISDNIPTLSPPGRIPGEGDCLLNGITYTNNTTVPRTNNCHTSCRCVNSIIKCDPIVCIPPPEYMENMNDCQPVYDSPDSCCPTYVCSPKETIPPQSHNQMSGTESPKPIAENDCTNDNCGSDKEQKPDLESSIICTSDGCSSEPVEKPSIQSQDDCNLGNCDNLPQIPVETSESCSGVECHEEPVIACDDENCKTKPAQVVDTSPICQGEEGCKTPINAMQDDCKDGICKSKEITKEETSISTDSAELTTKTVAEENIQTTQTPVGDLQEKQTEHLPYDETKDSDIDANLQEVKTTTLSDIETETNKLDSDDKAIQTELPIIVTDTEITDEDIDSNKKDTETETTLSPPIESVDTKHPLDDHAVISKEPSKSEETVTEMTTEGTEYTEKLTTDKTKDKEPTYIVTTELINTKPEEVFTKSHELASIAKVTESTINDLVHTTVQDVAATDKVRPDETEHTTDESILIKPELSVTEIDKEEDTYRDTTSTLPETNSDNEIYEHITQKSEQELDNNEQTTPQISKSVVDDNTDKYEEFYSTTKLPEKEIVKEEDVYFPTDATPEITQISLDNTKMEEAQPEKSEVVIDEEYSTSELPGLQTELEKDLTSSPKLEITTVKDNFAESHVSSELPGTQIDEDTFKESVPTIVSPTSDKEFDTNINKESFTTSRLPTIEKEKDTSGETEISSVLPIVETDKEKNVYEESQPISESTGIEKDTNALEESFTTTKLPEIEDAKEDSHEESHTSTSKLPEADRTKEADAYEASHTTSISPGIEIEQDKDTYEEIHVISTPKIDMTTQKDIYEVSHTTSETPQTETDKDTKISESYTTTTSPESDKNIHGEAHTIQELPIEEIEKSTIEPEPTILVNVETDKIQKVTENPELHEPHSTAGEKVDTSDLPKDHKIKDETIGITQVVTESLKTTTVSSQKLQPSIYEITTQSDEIITENQESETITEKHEGYNDLSTLKPEAIDQLIIEKETNIPMLDKSYPTTVPTIIEVTNPVVTESDHLATDLTKSDEFNDIKVTEYPVTKSQGVSITVTEKELTAETEDGTVINQDINTEAPKLQSTVLDINKDKLKEESYTELPYTTTTYITPKETIIPDDEIIKTHDVETENPFKSEKEPHVLYGELPSTENIEITTVKTSEQHTQKQEATFTEVTTKYTLTDDRETKYPMNTEVDDKDLEIHELTTPVSNADTTSDVYKETDVPITDMEKSEEKFTKGPYNKLSAEQDTTITTTQRLTSNDLLIDKTSNKVTNENEYTTQQYASEPIDFNTVTDKDESIATVIADKEDRMPEKPQDVRDETTIHPLLEQKFTGLNEQNESERTTTKPNLVFESESDSSIPKTESSLNIDEQQFVTQSPKISTEQDIYKTTEIQPSTQKSIQEETVTEEVKLTTILETEITNGEIKHEVSIDTTSPDQPESHTKLQQTTTTTESMLISADKDTEQDIDHLLIPDDKIYENKTVPHLQTTLSPLLKEEDKEIIDSMVTSKDTLNIETELESSTKISSDQTLDEELKQVTETHELITKIPEYTIPHDTTPTEPKITAGIVVTSEKPKSPLHITTVLPSYEVTNVEQNDILIATVPQTGYEISEVTSEKVIPTEMEEILPISEEGAPHTDSIIPIENITSRPSTQVPVEKEAVTEIIQTDSTTHPPKIFEGGQDDELIITDGMLGNQGDNRITYPTTQGTPETGSDKITTENYKQDISSVTKQTSIYPAEENVINEDTKEEHKITTTEILISSEVTTTSSKIKDFTTEKQETLPVQVLDTTENQYETVTGQKESDIVIPDITTEKPDKIIPEKAIDDIIQETSDKAQSPHEEILHEKITQQPDYIGEKEFTTVPASDELPLMTTTSIDKKEDHLIIYSTQIPLQTEDITTEKPDSIIPEKAIDDIIQETSDKSQSPHEEILHEKVTQQPDLIGEKEFTTVPESDELPLMTTTSIDKKEDHLTIYSTQIPLQPEELVTHKELHVESTTEDLAHVPNLESNSDIPLSTQKHEEPEKHKYTTDLEYTFTETTPFSIELEEHTHAVVEESSSIAPITGDSSIMYQEPERGDITPEQLDSTENGQEKLSSDITTQKEKIEEPVTHHITTIKDETKSEETTAKILPSFTSIDLDEQKKETTHSEDLITTSPKTINEQELFTTEHDKLQHITSPIHYSETSTEKDGLKPLEPALSEHTTIPEEQLVQELEKATTVKAEEESYTYSPTPVDKLPKPEDKPSDMNIPELPKPVFNEEPVENLPSPDFPPSGSAGYGQEPDYVEEDQAFGPGTCRYGGKVYVSAQQIPRDDPCDFCFCFRSDIICLQQSCPPPIHGCHEEPIQGFCCPRYECPVSMATTLNMTTTTTTTTTTLPPHFLPHAYKGAAQRRGCQIKGHTYKVGEVVRASSGPCLHCTCGGDGQMKCDPKACTPEPMLRQMIAAAVSAKRRR